MTAEPGEVTRLDDLEPGSYDPINGQPYPWWPDHRRRFSAWEADHPDAPYSSTVCAWWDSQRRARRAWRRR